MGITDILPICHFGSRQSRSQFHTISLVIGFTFVRCIPPKEVLFKYDLFKYNYRYDFTNKVLFKPGGVDYEKTEVFHVLFLL